MSRSEAEGGYPTIVSVSLLLVERRVMVLHVDPERVLACVHQVGHPPAPRYLCPRERVRQPPRFGSVICVVPR